MQLARKKTNVISHVQSIQFPPYLLLLITVFVSGCSSLDIEENRQLNYAFANGTDTSLGKIFTSSVETQSENISGFTILDTGRDAFLKRLAVIASADQAIDLQYYIWNSDHAGRLLAQQLLLAADRGVQVRILLDDFNIGERDGALNLLAAHSNIELRVYNPNATRTGFGKILGLLGDFGRLNQRMHNKSIVVDATVAVVGGRNIGDEYFDLHPAMNFRDRDVLAIGPIVPEVSRSFDAYWNNDRAFSMTSLDNTMPSDAEVSDFREQLKQRVIADEEYVNVAYAIDNIFDFHLNEWRDKMVWAEAELIFDQPLSIDQHQGDQIKRVAKKLADLARQVEKELLIESAYLIPGDEGVALLGKLGQKGVQVSALTNSLASNDLTTNHAGYTRRRKAMLDNLVELYELRPDAASCQTLVESSYRCDDDTLFGLHAKTMVFDRHIAFVGSFNVNQRSVFLNSETALIIYSQQLAEKIATDIEVNFTGDNSWRLQLTNDGNLEWVEHVNGEEIRYSHEPQTSFWRRFSSGFFSLFPIEKYL